MIDENELLESIKYSNNWNNEKCPEWVINLINAQTKMKILFDDKSCVHLLANNKKDNTDG